MNEQIKKLKDQAFNAVWDLDKTTIGPPTHFVPDGFEEKFAELIIQDSIKKILEWKNEPFPFDEHTAVWILKEHFRVEE